MADPRDAAALGVPTEGERHAEAPSQKPSTPILARWRVWVNDATRAQAAERARARARKARSGASVELDEIIAWLYPNGPSRHGERFERACANDLARQGFDHDYLAQRYGLTKRGV